MPAFWGGIFSARSVDIPNDRAETMLAVVQPTPLELNGTFGLEKFEEHLASQARNLLLDQMVYLIVCTAPQEALGPSFSPPLTKLFCSERLSLLALAPAERYSFPKSSEVDAQGLIIRSPEALRPLTLCRCDREVITAAMCSGLRRYSIECVHPPQICVVQRIMTDNIFEIETAAGALRTRYSEDPGLLLTNFSCAYPSVDRRWIFLVLERAGVPQTLPLPLWYLQ